MNKFMLKISTILLGAFMTIGAGVTMAGINENVQKVNAAGNNVATYTVASKTSVTKDANGMYPESSNVTYENNDPNNKDQMTAGKRQLWTLQGFENTRIFSITANLHKNKDSGYGDVVITHAGSKIGSKSFTTNGLTKSYKEYEIYSNNEGLDITADVILTLTSKENSFYCNSVTVTWADATPVEDNFTIDETKSNLNIVRGDTGNIYLSNITGNGEFSTTVIMEDLETEATGFTFNSFDQSTSSIPFEVSHDVLPGLYYLMINKGTTCNKDVIITVCCSNQEGLQFASGSRIEINPGDSYTFVVRFNGETISPEELDWIVTNKSSDIFEAEAVNGVLSTAVDEGYNGADNFVVTATHKTYTYADGTKLSASCSVQFKSSLPYLEIDNSDLTFFKGQTKSVTVTANNFTADTEISVTVTGEKDKPEMCSWEVISGTNYNVKEIKFTGTAVGTQTFTITLINGTETASDKVTITIKDDEILSVSWSGVPTIKLDQGEQLTWEHLKGTLTATYSFKKPEPVDMSRCDVLVNDVVETLPYFVKTTDNTVGLRYNGIKVTETATLTVNALTLTAQTTSTVYKKVTEELTDWSGEYLIGYEASATELRAMKCEGEAYDSPNNYVTTTIEDGVVKDISNNLKTATATIEKVEENGKYAMKLGDMYITNSKKNVIAGTDAKYIYNIEYNSSDVIKITSSNYMLLFNKTWPGFRFYGSTSSSVKDIQLYKSCEITSMETINVSEAICDFVNAVNATFTCSAEHDLSAETLTNLQATLVEEYGKLTEADKNILKTAESKELGGNLVEQFLSRYDYIFAKYNINDTLGRNTTRNIRSAYMSNRDVKRANSMLLIIGLVGISLVSYGIYSLTKKKEEK